MSARADVNPVDAIRAVTTPAGRHGLSPEGRRLVWDQRPSTPVVVLFTERWRKPAAIDPGSIFAEPLTPCR